MMDAQREMTLDEWVGTLPPIHGARNELAELRRQLAEAEDKLSDANESWDLCKQLQLNAEAKLALAEQLLRRCLTALKIGECDMHYHLKSGIRVSLVQQLEEATKEAAK